MQNTIRIFRALMGVLFLITLTVLLVAPPEASAQRYDTVTALSYVGTYTNCAGSSATNVNVIIDTRKQDKVMVQGSFMNDAAGTAVLGFYFCRSADGTYYDGTNGTAGQYVTVAAAGNATVHFMTNLPSYGAGYLKLAYVTNAAAATVNTTNLTVKYAVKIGAP